MKKIYFLLEKLSTSKLSILFLLFSFFISSAQVTTNSGSGLAANYPDLATAITALNGATITSPVVITLTGNETAPAGGYSITAQGDAINTIIVEGVTSTITANAALTVGALNDAIFKLVGADYVTIRNFTMQENAANTVSATGATNNMTEWGVALLYLTATNGAQNNTIQGNTISLDRTYRNTFGIYSNSTHTEAAVTVSASATGAAGSNTGLSVLSNNISNINLGIAVVGPTAAADFNQSLTIGGAGFANTITNFGTNVQLSGYANVSGTGYGVLVRNTVNYTVSYNTITSSNGGYTSTTAFRGIFVPAFSVAPVGTFNHVVNDNVISLRPGASAATTGIEVAATTGSATTNLSISNNDFNTTTHTVAATSAIIFINSLVVNLNTTISNNTFSNLSVNTSGGVTFISNSVSRALGGVRTISDNRIVGTFAKTTAGGTVLCFTAADFAPAGTSFIANNNNFSNITLTGATTFTGWNSNDGNTATDGPTKVFSNNTFSNLTLGSNASTITFFAFGGNSTTQISNNLISNITAAGTVIGMNMGGSNTTVNAYQNTISNITTTGASVNAAQIGSGNVSFTRNKIVNIEANNATGVVNGLTISTGLATTSHLIANNIIGDLRAPITSAANDAIKGVNITSTSATTTNNVYNNSIYLAATSSGVNFSTSGVFHTYSATATTSTLDLRNNVIVNSSTANGTGNVVALRRSAATDLNNFATTSNNNDLFAANIYADGTNLDATLGAYQTRVAARESLSISVMPSFLSLVSSNVNFLHVDTTIPTFLESGATSIGSITNDFDGDIRQGVGGYIGTGLAPDMGADEFEGIPSTPQCAGTPAAANALSSAVSVCSGVNFNLSLSTAYTELNYSYQWQSSPDGIIPYTNILGQNGATASLNQSAATFYQCVITCVNSGLFVVSLPIQVTMNPVFNCFCTASVSSAADTDIGNITFGSLNNGTATPILSNATAVNTYTNFTGLPATNIVQGEATTFSLSQITNGGTFYAAYANVFIDYNGNGVFDLPAERVLSTGPTVVTPLNNLLTGNITIPITSVTGNVFMRVILLEGGSSATPACNPLAGGTTYGEVEDYLINILPCVAPTIGTEPISQSICENSNVTFTVAATGSGLTYQWKKGGVDILSANSDSYTITGAVLADAGDYTVLVTGACGTDLSNIATLIVTPNTSNLTTISACDSYLWAVNGTTYTLGGIYNNVVGCHTETLDLTINTTPVADAPANVTACDSYTLPALTVGNYFTGTGGTGTALSAGNNITSTQTIYVYAETATTPNCTDENSFIVTINTTPVADAPVNVTSCDSYTLPALTVGNYFTGTGGTGTALSAGNNITSTQTIYVYAETGTTPNCTDENSFVVTINNSPVADAPANVAACDSYTLPALTVGNYFTGTGGTGTALSAGNNITSTQTIYVYAETGTTPNCTDENSFVVTINVTPVADAPANVTACDSYILPALTVGNYFTGAGGTGTALSAGNSITSTQTIYVYAATGTTPNCTDENSFMVTINNSPVADAPANVTACDSYILPALTVGNYFTGAGGTGTALSAGNSITSTQTIYVYAETGTTPNCTDENSFVVTITIATISGSTTQVLNGGIASDVTIEDIVVTSNGTVTWFASSADAAANVNPLPAGTVLVDGNIYYGVTNIGSCRSTTLAVTVTVVLGTSSFDLSQLNYYPNPVKDIFNVKYTKEIISVDVYDLTGRKVIEMKPNTLEVQLNMTNLSNAMYIVRLQSVDGITELKVYKN